jgi:hypothetical protein
MPGHPTALLHLATPRGLLLLQRLLQQNLQLLAFVLPAAEQASQPALEGHLQLLQLQLQLQVLLQVLQEQRYQQHLHLDQQPLPRHPHHPLLLLLLLLLLQCLPQLQLPLYPGQQSHPAAQQPHLLLLVLLLLLGWHQQQQHRRCRCHCRCHRLLLPPLWPHPACCSDLAARPMQQRRQQQPGFQEPLQQPDSAKTTHRTAAAELQKIPLQRAPSAPNQQQQQQIQLQMAPLLLLVLLEIPSPAPPLLPQASQDCLSLGQPQQLQPPDSSTDPSLLATQMQGQLQCLLQGYSQGPAALTVMIASPLLHHCHCHPIQNYPQC